MGKLDGKIALVTGGNSGIGLACAKRFVAEGATVVITGRRQPELDAAVTELGPRARAVRTDVSRLAELDALFADIAAHEGRLDVVMANAGVAKFVTLEDVTEEHFDETFAINVKGTLFTVQKALPLMTNGGSIILTGSTASISGYGAFSVYSATKAAIRSFARCWIRDLKGRGIRVNVVSPGNTKTPGLLGLVPAEHGERFLENQAARTPLGRVGSPEEIASVALFLASEDSSYVTGVELFADGGDAQV
ncbi:MAG TPA: SDR family oxidoreductase [Kofleriaceae bacterium]|nr:SDR family oxidoreductase [Kofleriaceae bacterium]